MKNRILLLTHTDFDGLVPEVILKHVFRKENVDVERCNYNTINTILYNVYKERIQDYDKVYITDISISEKMAIWTENNFKDKVMLIDHHPTAEFLNKYDWANVTVKDDNGKSISASKLVATHFKVTNPVILDIVEQVNDYDCWHWATNGNIRAKKFNDLVYAVGFDEMVEEFLLQAEHGNYKDFIFQEKYEFLLDIREKEYKHYMEASNKSLSIAKYKGYNIGITFAERFTSELGNDLAKLHPELDFIGLVNMRSGLSLRGIKKDIDLGLLAKEIGEQVNLKAGGHPQAAGITMDTKYKLNMLSNIFTILE